MDRNSGLYIYCIMNEEREIYTDSQPIPIFGNIGVRNQPVNKVRYGDLSAVVSNFSLQQLQANVDDVVAHQRVVEAIRKETRATVLPVRFGTVLRNQREVTNLLSKSHNEYKSQLLRFNGKDEFGIKVLITNTAKEKFKDLVEAESEQIKKIKSNISSLSPANSGSEYLLKLSLRDAIKNEVFKKIERLALEIHSKFAEISVDATILKADAEQIILNAAYIINQNNPVTFESKLMEIKKRYEGLGLVFHMSGPWAPYSFC